MATTQKTTTPPPNSKEIRGPNGDTYIVPMNTQIWPGWTDTGKYQTLPTAPKAMNFATLVSANGSKEYVAVGGTRANDLLGQGWVLSGSNKTPTDQASKDKVGGTNANQTSGPTSTKHVLDGGDFYVCKFSDDPTPNNGIDETAMKWVFDVKKKVFRPISGREAEVWLASQLGLASIDTHSISTTDLQNADSVFHGSSFLPKSYAIKADGSFPAYPEEVMYKPDAPNPSQSAKDQITGKVYGKDPMSATQIEPVVQKTMDFVNYLKDKNYISQDTYGKLSSNNWINSTFTDAVNAAAYGGYSMDDIWRDIKAIDTGSSDTGFSRKLTSADFRNTSAYKTSISNQSYVPTGDLAAKLSAYQGVAVSALPDDLYSAKVGISSVKSSTDLDSARQLNAAYYDLLKLQATANTEAEQSQAKAAFNQFKQKVEKTYGLKLSSDAYSSWGAIQNIMDQATTAGVSGSGYERGLINDKLRANAKMDEQIRNEKQSTISDQEISNALKYGTPEEISSLISKLDSEDAANGLTPAAYRSNQFKAPASLSAAYSIDNLRKLYPGLNDTELNEIRSAYIDPNGNLVSDAMSKLAEKKSGYSTANIQAGVTNQTNAAAKAAIDASKAIAASTGNSPTSGDQFKNKDATPKIEPPSDAAKTETTPTTTPTTTPPAPVKTYASDSGVDAGEAELQRLAAASKVTPTIATPKINTPLTQTQSNVPAGATYISNPNDLKSLSEKQIYRDTSSGKIYKLANIGK